MSRQPITVTYHGKQHGLKDLAKQKGIPTATVWERWKNDGRPDTITDDIFAPVGARLVKRQLTLDGQRILARTIASVFNCSQSTVCLKVKKY